MQQDYLHINIQQMYYFIEVMECRSFTIAAQNLYTTQSTLSKTISSLEQVLDVRLFIRNYKRLLPTDAGTFLYNKWKQLLIDLESSVNECRILHGGHASSLSIGILDTHETNNYLPLMLNHFYHIHPEIMITIHAYSVQESRKLLYNDTLDLIFTTLYDVEQFPTEEFHSLVINECPHNICMLPENPLAQKEYLELSDLKESTFIIISPMYVPTYIGMIEDLFRNAGFRPHIIKHVTSAYALPYNLRNKTDVFICDRNYRGYGNPKYVFRPIIHTKSGIIAAWKKTNTRKELQDFIEIIQKSIDP